MSPDLLFGGFTDELLDPRRTSRRSVDPVLDAGDSLVRGDLLLVDVTAYAPEAGRAWCKALGSAVGSAAVFPYRVAIPGCGVGQYAADEVYAWARPLELHRALTAARGAPA